MTTIFGRLAVLSALATATCAQAQLSITIDPTGGDITLTGSGTVATSTTPFYRSLMLNGAAGPGVAGPSAASGNLVIADDPAAPVSPYYEVGSWLKLFGQISLVASDPNSTFFPGDRMAGTLTLIGFDAGQLSGLGSGPIITVLDGGVDEQIGVWTVVPEPGPLPLLAVGGMALLAARRKPATAAGKIGARRTRT